MATGEEKIKQNRIITDRFIDIMYHLIGKRVIRDRKQFAESVGLASANLYRLEREGTMNVPLYSIEMAYNKYNINLAYLFTGHGDLINNK